MYWVSAAIITLVLLAAAVLSVFNTWFAPDSPRAVAEETRYAYEQVQAKRKLYLQQITILEDAYPERIESLRRRTDEMYGRGDQIAGEKILILQQKLPDESSANKSPSSR